MALKMCVQAGNHEQYLIPYLNNDAYPVDLAEVSNLIYWMARIQSHLGLGPRGFGRWNHQLLPSHVALSAIESATKARRLALNNMHENYAQRRIHHQPRYRPRQLPLERRRQPLYCHDPFNLVHTRLDCLGAVHVKEGVGVVKGPAEDSEPLMKDFGTEILAQNPATSSPAHWLATTLIRRLPRPIDNVGDLLAALSTRSTSWVRDRTIISALLAQVPDCDLADGESIIAAQVLSHLGKIPYSCLFHGKPTMRDRGPWSWCPATLFDMPGDTASDLAHSSGTLTIDGAVEGMWQFHKMDREKARQLEPTGQRCRCCCKS